MTGFTRILPAVLLAGSVRLGAQVNDNCAGAIAIASPSVTAGNTTSATTTAGLTGCQFGPDLWYKFTSPWTGTAEVSTCAFLGGSADFDTVINVWSWIINPCTSGCGLCGPGHIGCNDDYCGSQSYYSFPVSIGQTYWISVGGWNGQTGSFSLFFYSWPDNAPNDSCATAIPITLAAGSGGENSGASTGPDPVGGCGFMAKDMWYSFVAPSCGTFTASTCGFASFDTVIAVWQGSCGSLTQIACNDDNCSSGGSGHNLHSTATFNGTLGTTYFISVGGFSGAFGTFSVFVSGSGPTPFTLAFNSNGPGTIGYAISGSPTGGAVFTAVSLVAGAYPNGWFHGIDIQISDLVGQWLTGYPFVTVPGGACSTASVGPFGGLPAGLTAYGVSLYLPGGSTMPSVISPPASGIVP
jgi:hypothetical protein